MVSVTEPHAAEKSNSPSNPPLLRPRKQPSPPPSCSDLGGFNHLFQNKTSGFPVLQRSSPGESDHDWANPDLSVVWGLWCVTSLGRLDIKLSFCPARKSWSLENPLKPCSLILCLFLEDQLVCVCVCVRPAADSVWLCLVTGLCWNWQHSPKYETSARVSGFMFHRKTNNKDITTHTHTQRLFVCVAAVNIHTLLCLCGIMPVCVLTQQTQ